MYKNLYTFLISSIVALNSLGAAITFTGNAKTVITEKADASTGLNDIFVIYDTNGVTASYKAKTSNVTWMKYGSYGGGYAEEIACVADGNVYTVVLDSNDTGFIIEDGTDRYYCWIVNYANHYAQLSGLSFADDQDCDRARLQLIGNADKITYYTINGQAKTLSRNLLISYNTLTFDESSETFIQKNANATFEAIDGTIGVAAPLCDTYFTISGDKFLEKWGLGQEAESSNYQAIAVEAHTSAIQEERNNDNEQKVEATGLGGSAPVDITFKAIVSDAAIFTEWQISSDPEFQTILDRYQQLEFNYTFRDLGNYYVQFIANNAAATCEYAGENYSINVGESALLCPNAFSPGSSEGTNDEWRVSYKSIIQFECHIFNRWGQEMCSFTDPGQGWDGKYKGKLVPPGAYYYVIKATGADGRNYNLSGDINIVKTKTNQSYTPED